VWTVEEVRQESEVPDSMGIRRAKPETSKGQKEVNYTPGLTEWLVSTLLWLVLKSFLTVDHQSGFMSRHHR
jgi:hypothetical protein